MDLQHTVDEIAALVGGHVRGSGDRPLTGLRSLRRAQATDLAAVYRAEYLRHAAESQAGALLVSRGVDLEAGDNRSLIEVDDPEQAMDLVVERLGPPIGDPPPGVHPSAVVEGGARIDPTASVGAHAVVASGAVVGPRARLWARVFIGQDALIGEDCRLYPGVYIGARCRLGQRVTIHPNAVIGGDGFGYRPDSEGRFIKNPQGGHVVLADDVEIGACTTIDRARLETTRVDRGAKIDNLVHLAHNCVVGEDTAIAAQTGMAGRASLGRHVQVAGHCAINSGTHVADRTILGGMTGIMKDTRPGEFLVGFPAYPKREWTRLHLSLRKVPALLAAQREQPTKTAHRSS